MAKTRGHALEWSICFNEVSIKWLLCWVFQSEVWAVHYVLWSCDSVGSKLTACLQCIIKDLSANHCLLNCNLMYQYNGFQSCFLFHEQTGVCSQSCKSVSNLSTNEDTWHCWLVHLFLEQHQRLSVYVLCVIRQLGFIAACLPGVLYPPKNDSPQINS